MSWCYAGEHGYSQPPRLQSRSPKTIKMMVNVGLGWSVLPETLVDDGLQALPVDTAPLVRHLSFITHHKHPMSNAAKAFIDVLLAPARPY